LAGDFADGQRVAGVVGVDFFYGFGDLEESQDRINWIRRNLFHWARIVSGYD
jgi:hypothetical protein